MKFYHFNTKDKLNETNIDNSDIAFCKEDKVIRTHGIEYFNFEWEEIPSSSNIIYPGLIAAWDIKREGKDNNHPDRKWARDLTGNGHDIQWKNVAFSEMSGYGGYTGNFNNWKLFNNNDTYYQTQIINGEKFKCRIGGTSSYALIYSKPQEYPYEKFKFKVTGIANVCTMNFGFGGTYYFENRIEEDGIYEIDIKTFAIEQNRVNDVGFKFFSLKGDGIIEDADIFVELIPEYEGAICLDGIDDYGSVYDLPQLTDCTFIGKFLIIKEKSQYGSQNGFYATSTRSGGSNAGWLLLQGNDTDKIRRGDGKGYENMTIPNGIINKPLITVNIRNTTTQRLSTYINETYGDMACLGSNEPLGINMMIGTSNTAITYERLLNGTFYSLYVFDRVLSNEEIKSFIRKYIDPEYYLPSEVVTPDCYYDFSQGSNDDENREIIKDYSGNGNDAKAYNIGWSGMSGYGGNAPNKNINWSKNSNEYDNISFEKEGYIIKIEGIKNNGSSIIYATFDSFGISKNENLKVKVSGLQDGKYVSFGNKFIYTNGIHIFKLAAGDNLFRIKSDDVNGNITIEFIPEYEGALVLDGVDDYIESEYPFTSNESYGTVFLLCKPIGFGYCYDQYWSTITSLTLHLLKDDNLAYIGYESDKLSKDIRINGNIVNSTIKTKDILNKKNLVTITRTITTKGIDNKPNIGRKSFGGSYCNMAIYKFLGFKEKLTEEQIQYVIEKYNLLDGVDEIEVS